MLPDLQFPEPLHPVKQADSLQACQLAGVTNRHACANLRTGVQKKVAF
jgi:hypothetical protein